MSRRVTLKDIADACGVSVPTVSLALRDHSTIAKATRAKVQAAADRIGYRPNPILSSLAARQFKRSERTLAAGLVYLAVEHPTDVSWPFQQEMQAEADALGYRLIVASLSGDQSLSTRMKRWYHQGVQGLILSDDPRPLLNDPEAELSRFSVVSLTGRWREIYWHNFRSDPDQFMRRAVDELLSRGYRRPGIAIIQRGPRWFDDEVRHSLALYYQQAFPELVPSLVGPDVTTEDQFYAWIEKYKPDAIAAFPSVLSWWLEKKGWRIPEDIAYVDISQYSELSSRKFTGCYQAEDLVSQRCIRMLDSMIRHGERGTGPWPVEVRIPGHWNPGESLPPPKVGAHKKSRLRAA